jgi:seipin
MVLLLPNFCHNHEVGVFQIRAEAVSVNEITIASTAQTYMIKVQKFSGSVSRLSTVNRNDVCVTLTMGKPYCNHKSVVLQGRPWLSLCHKKTGLIRLLLQSRAASVQTIFHGQRAWYAA